LNQWNLYYRYLENYFRELAAARLKLLMVWPFKLQADNQKLNRKLNKIFVAKPKLFMCSSARQITRLLSPALSSKTGKALCGHLERPAIIE